MVERDGIKKNTGWEGEREVEQKEIGEREKGQKQ